MLRWTLTAMIVLLGGCGLTLDTDPPDVPTMFADAGGIDAAAEDAGRDDAAPGDAGGDGGSGDAGEERDAALADAGDASMGCATDTACDDADACTADTCVAGTCASSPIVCRPDPCHLSLGCDPIEGCLLEAIDDDEDGFTLRVPMVCGEDCDDTESSIHPGAAEVCDGVDQNCDGRVDEGVSISCGRDLDRDGFGSSVDVIASCDAACPGGTVANLDDCWDEAVTLSNLAHPGQRTYFTMPRGPTGSGSYDWSCDGIEEPLLASALFAMCPAAPAPGVDCDVFSGWASVIPECGASADYIRCLTTPSGGCTPSTSSSTQACR